MEKTFLCINFVLFYQEPYNENMMTDFDVDKEKQFILPDFP